jgi:hypothetical protein
MPLLPARIILCICILTTYGFGSDVCLLRLESVNTDLLVTLNVPPSAQQGPIATTPDVFVKVRSGRGLLWASHIAVDCCALAYVHKDLVWRKGEGVGRAEPRQCSDVLSQGGPRQDPGVAALQQALHTLRVHNWALFA